jgi:LysM repeat protein
MNPALDSFYLPRGVYQVNLPAGSSQAFLKAWEQSGGTQTSPVMSPQPLPARRIAHVVKRGETLASISRRYQVSVADLCKWNNLDPHVKLNAGKKLVIFVK